MNRYKNSVAICMAVYNGEKYIAEQIESILNQTFTDWMLFIRDDGSTDLTVEIVERIAAKYPDKIELIHKSILSGGSPEKNFASILKWVTEHYPFNYFMFSDQDDFWLRGKIEKTYKVMKETETVAGGPILVHTDLKVVDSELKESGSSFFAYRALNPQIKDINHLLVQNNITGCTMMWNKALNDLVELPAGKAVMHDWWFALAASCFGTIVCVEEQTILYRQHDRNAVGATRVNTPGFIIMRLRGKNHVKDTIRLSVEQAAVFYEHYTDRLDEKQRKIIKQYADLYSHRKIVRIKEALRGKYLKQGIVQIIGELMFI